MRGNKRYKINNRIRVPEVRLVGEGEAVVMKTAEALKQARSKGLDLVLITENTNPPVAKILDFNKYLYEENKKSAQIKAKSKKSKLKEFKLGANIAEDAIQMRAKRAREFIEDGNRVRVTVIMKGRQKAHPEIAKEKIDIFLESLKDVAKPEGAIKKQGSSAVFVVLVKD